MSEALHPDEKLLDFAYGELPPADREGVKSHVESCAHCREELASIRSVRTAMAPLADAEPAPDAGLASLLAYAEKAAERSRAVPVKAPSGLRRWLAPLMSAGVLGLIVAVAFGVNGLGSGASFAPRQDVLARNEAVRQEAPAPSALSKASRAPSAPGLELSDDLVASGGPSAGLAAPGRSAGLIKGKMDSAGGGRGADSDSLAGQRVARNDARAPVVGDSVASAPAEEPAREMEAKSEAPAASAPMAVLAPEPEDAATRQVAKKSTGFAKDAAKRASGEDDFRDALRSRASASRALAAKPTSPPSPPAASNAEAAPSKPTPREAVEEKAMVGTTALGAGAAEERSVPQTAPPEDVSAKARRLEATAARNSGKAREESLNSLCQLKVPPELSARQKAACAQLVREFPRSEFAPLARRALAMPAPSSTPPDGASDK